MSSESISGVHVTLVGCLKNDNMIDRREPDYVSHETRHFQLILDRVEDKSRPTTGTTFTESKFTTAFSLIVVVNFTQCFQVLSFRRGWSFGKYLSF